MASNPLPYYLKNGEKRYRIAYRKPDHSQGTKRGFKRSKDAKDWAARIEISLNDNDFIDPASGEVTIGVLARTYLEGKEGAVKPSYKRDLESAWRVHVQPKWGNRAVNTIRRSEIQTWVSRLATGDEKHGMPGRSASVVIRAYDLLKQILDMAVADRLIRKTPCVDISLPRKTRKERTYLDEAQVLALADASGKYRTLILVLGFCGLRMGEARGLKVAAVDMENNRIRVLESVTRVNREYVASKPKTWETREVPVPEFVMQALREQCKGKDSSALVFNGRAHDGYLGEYRRGSYGWYSRALAASDTPSLTIHDLRHTAASIAIHSGANVKAVQRMLGHKTATMTLDLYADLFDSDLDAVAENVNRKIECAVTTT
ncbi:site-specific integrase [Bifidobacterium callitrichidarum]|uniref:Site-specific integrase n=1 Tax=Bifidobacterium callitrichidarum TaxID=2052941 RepID=A0A2U2N481_9BIFI|nr:site-specific integrase [Bifidobacterium callitrichidarum]PWG63838.1 site-specific integrase [Bifidobacterium callitrichidarum]